MVADLAFCQTGGEVVRLDFGLAADLGQRMPSEATYLPGGRNEAHAEIKGVDAELSVFDATVGAFGFGSPAEGR